jgi:hypothetical protein
MNTEITQQQMKTVALAAAFVPHLQQLIQIATMAEAMLPQRPAYGQFIEESKKLCEDFGTLCRAGDTDAMIERFRQTLFCCVAAQQNTTQSQVN